MTLPEFASGPPKPKDPNLHWVETLDGGRKIKLKVYSSSIWEVWTHFTGKTKPCFKDKRFCEGGHDEGTLRWYGYVFGYNMLDQKKCFVQITEAARRQWLEQIASGVTLRGQVIEISRTASKKGRLCIQVNQYMSSGEENLPPDVDPRPSLYRLWKVKDLADNLKHDLGGGPADDAGPPKLCLVS